MKAKKANSVLVYADEPKGSPLRMQCKKCAAAPGQKCRKGTGRGNSYEMDNFHPVREADWIELRNIEFKMAQMNREYGKADAR